MTTSLRRCIARLHHYKTLLFPTVILGSICTLIYLVIFRSLGLYVYDNRSLAVLTPQFVSPQLDAVGINSPAPIFDATRVFYNRVPKCGSRTILRLFETIANQNGVNISHCTIYNKKYLNETEQQSFVKEFSVLPKPAIFDRHLYYVDFERYGQQSPVYINLIRDPYERILSRHYYILHESVNTPEQTRDAFNMTFEECVRKNIRYCVSPSNLIELVRYFCGQDPVCSSKGRVNDAAMLSRAKQNVIKHFAVVGLIEDTDMFFRLLEKRLPKMFAGAHSTYLNMISKLETRYVNPKKVVPPDEIKYYVISLMRESYDFYQFIKQRNYNMLHNIVKET